MNFTYLRELCWFIFYLIGPGHNILYENIGTDQVVHWQRVRELRENHGFDAKEVLHKIVHLLLLPPNPNLPLPNNPHPNLPNNPKITETIQPLPPHPIKPLTLVQKYLIPYPSDVIIDMITVSTYNCPKGYEPYTSARWEGTKEGCLCQTSLGEYDYVHVLPVLFWLCLGGVYVEVD